MNDLDFKPNSHKSKEEKKAVEKKKDIKPVVTNKVTRKKNVGRKISDTFISEDINNVKSYIWLDVLVPAIKKSISDIIINSVEMVLYGESGRSRDRSKSSTYTSYRDYYDDRKDERRSNRSRTGYSYDDITFRTRYEAEKVLDAMDAIIDEYDVVSVAEFYELADEPSSHTDYKYGWSNLSRAEIMHCREGFYIKFPKATPID